MQCKSFPCTLWGLPACSTKSADSQSRPSSFLLSLSFKNNRHFRGYFEQGGFSFSRWMDSWLFVFFYAYCATLPVMRPLSCPETEQLNLPMPHQCTYLNKSSFQATSVRRIFEHCRKLQRVKMRNDWDAPSYFGPNPTSPPLFSTQQKY